MSELDKALRGAQDAISAYAKEAGLDFFDVIFELLDWDELNAVAAYGGFPNRYPHWRFGMDYERLSKTYEYGYSKIYEMVINNDPCYAYLMRSNSLIDQKMVMAHVCGHSDFFKNNFSFKHSNRKMMDQAGTNRSRIQRLMLRYGVEVVEDFIDVCLSLENLIDLHAPMRGSQPQANSLLTAELSEEPELNRRPKVRSYLESYLETQLGPEKKPEPARTKEPGSALARPERDILLYLLEHAPLERWQQDALAVIREESYYFTPQGRTKIVNEGWAAFWHSELMTKKILRDSEILDYASRHASTVSGGAGSLNPYKIGMELLRDIERRWDMGRFGKDYEACDDMHERENWNKQTGLGRAKIFEVRKFYDDVTFIDAFITPEFCEVHQFFTYVYDPKSHQYEIESRDFAAVKKKLLQQLTNGGNPIVELTHGNYEGRGELYLRHLHEGVDLRLDYAKETLKNLYALWKRPVHLETRVDDLPRLFSFDGKEHKEQRLSES